mmetsp:Transcript_32587/g.48246  ORF Transcript_32587/g.48246 Transcript_32587/m.48246 type:complete len:213 (+) Transcript_32587:2481-3119(+)
MVDDCPPTVSVEPKLLEPNAPKGLSVAGVSNPPPFSADASCPNWGRLKLLPKAPLLLEPNVGALVPDPNVEGALDGTDPNVEVGLSWAGGVLAGLFTPNWLGTPKAKGFSPVGEPKVILPAAGALAMAAPNGVDDPEAGALALAAPNEVDDPKGFDDLKGLGDPNAGAVLLAPKTEGEDGVLKRGLDNAPNGEPKGEALTVEAADRLSGVSL